MSNDDIINQFFGKAANAGAGYRCGYVAIVGRPNVGKSTLLNHILGQKLSITSRKPQTTRHRILGIATGEGHQTVYVDTPGIHGEERKAINRYMNRAATAALRDVDLVLFVVDGLKWVPDDNEGKRGLAVAYRGLGQSEKAQAIEKGLVSAAGAAGASSGAPGTQDLMGAGVNLYNDKKYAEAAVAFEKAVAAEPNNRDALSNLSNTYLALKDGPKLLASATKLVAIEPMSETALKLQGEGYKQSGKVDDAITTAEKVLALPVDVKITEFSPNTGGAALAATATGRAAQTPSGKSIAAAPVGLVFEFLDARGGVVATQETQVPALAAGAARDIKLTAQGTGITAWRYKRK